MMNHALEIPTVERHDVGGGFVTINGERYYAIRNIDGIDPFFISVVSNADHWLFASSTGGLTAGRVSPDTSLFPYVSVDKIHDSATHTGCKTIIRCGADDEARIWEPFDRQHVAQYNISRNLYKNVLGNKLCFEEHNHDLNLVFRYIWQSSDEFGFVRHCELSNPGPGKRRVEVLDGLRNVLPAGTPPRAQTNASNLVDAYKRTELHEPTGLAIFSLYSGISDRAEPCESLRANVVYVLGLEEPTHLLSTAQLGRFRDGLPIASESSRRGLRGAYFVATDFDIAPGQVTNWTLVADIEKTQADVLSLQLALADKGQLASKLASSVEHGTRELAATIASADGFASVNEEIVSAHHYSNVLFNILRGGVFDKHNLIPAADLRATIAHCNSNVYERNVEWLEALPDSLPRADLLVAAQSCGDEQLERLCLEYLPIRFGRRHGDPSRPWNHFSIRLKDGYGNPLLSYEGNWRDIFQNWEALLLSYPEFIESVIAKFVNASTADGYNPYRIMKNGIDWEVEEDDNPWSYIGYWGDHQVIYLQKLLELSQQFHPAHLGNLLHRRVFSYANVPYRIRSFAQTWKNPKKTVDFDHAKATQIENDVQALGADAKLLRDHDGQVCQVTLLEKLLVTLLAKLCNVVIDGGVWLNTQRPEWNDANNALVGHGMSMVTLCYMRRFVVFLRDLLAGESGDAMLSANVASWLGETAGCLAAQQSLLAKDTISGEERYAAIAALGEAACRYRTQLYDDGPGLEFAAVPPGDVVTMLDHALAVIEKSIGANRRDDGLYNAYNLIVPGDGQLDIDTLYPMLEGQVAVLSSGALEPSEACEVLEALFESAVFRRDQHSFMLYPDRELLPFLDKNVVPTGALAAIPLAAKMLAAGDARIIERDPLGQLRFHADFVNVEVLEQRLYDLRGEYGSLVEESRELFTDLYEDVFDHRSFTGRSGGMFGFEGLGCVYWHMVAKLLLAVQENYFNAVANGAADARRLGKLYYQVRDGLGFNKTPEEFGAFPADPYSHTPGHSGARQPGMTGAVKEEILTRMGELGVRVFDGIARFDPGLLRGREFHREPQVFRYLDVDGRWVDLDVPADGLAFTWCQVPVCYVLEDSAPPRIELRSRDGASLVIDKLELRQDLLDALTSRQGDVCGLRVYLPRSSLFSD